MDFEAAYYHDSDGFSLEHARAIREIREAIRKRDPGDAEVMLDRYFDIDGSPR